MIAKTVKIGYGLLLTEYEEIKMTKRNSVICYAKRTAIGKFSGGFATTTAPQLTATLIKDALTATKIDGSIVDEIIMGNVLTAGVGQAPARQAAIYGGLPNSVCATTIGRVCGSGLKAVMLADQAIRLGDADIVMAGGQENMTLAPHLLQNSRAGYRFGSFQAVDSMQHDGLWDPYNDVAMGVCGETCAREYKFTRQQQDDYAVESYKRARNATENGHFKNEIVPVEVKSRKSTVVVDSDEEPFASDLERLIKLRPAFDKEGTITAGNASSINDGSALVIVTSEESAQKHGLTPVARIVAQASHAQDPMWFTTAPVGAMQKLLNKASWGVDEVDLFEINEAFAVVPMAAMRDLKIDREKVNIHGGAVSLGHPIGCSGARILVTLLNALQAQNQKRGVASLCIGGGEASAMAIEML
jgi:acetyl-CoA C-acetyltransferase